MNRISPIAIMQRQLGHHPMEGLGYLGASLHLAGFGNTLTQSAVTGVKTGTTAATVSTAIGTGVASAIGAGAAAGSFIPVIGTAIGAIVGLVASGVFNHRVDPEVGNFNNAVALFHQNPDNIYNIADKYLVLAGLFDLLPGQIKGNIPIYKKYGRMGEQRFTQDMMTRIYEAAQNGVIGPNDTPQSVMNKVVQPWIDSFGFGPMQDSNAEMIHDILVGMIAEYVTGLWKKRWFARSGDFPNWQIPMFSLPAGAGTAPSTAGTPTQAAAPPPVATPKTTPVTSLPSTPVPSTGIQQQSSIPIPAGFQLAGTDPSGLPAYVGPDGRLYSWNGVSMTPSAAPTVTSGVNPALYGNLGYPSAPSSAPTFITLPGTAAAQPQQVMAAGVTGNGLPPWLTWAAVGGVALLLFATARPLPMRGGYKKAAA